MNMFIRSLGVPRNHTVITHNFVPETGRTNAIIVATK